MGLEAVVEEIREKGRSEAEKIRAASRQDADQIIAAATKRGEEIKLAAEEESAKQSAHLVSQDVSAANLLVKREILNTQKALLDQVYETTRKDIAALPESFHREAIKKLLAEAKKEIPKGRVFCNARDQAAAKAVPDVLEIFFPAVKVAQSAQLDFRGNLASDSLPYLY